MLKTLFFALLLLAVVHCDDDDQYEEPEIKEYWSHAPVHTWTRFATFSLSKKGNQTWVDMDIRVNIYPFPADRHLKRLYELYNMPRDWWSSACVLKKHKQTQQYQADVIMDTVGTTDVEDAFLLDKLGKIVVTLQQYNKLPPKAQEGLMSRGECWAVYRSRQLPWVYREWARRFPKHKHMMDYEQFCIPYRAFYVKWFEAYGVCVNKGIVSYPEMLKHGNRGTKD